MTAAATIAVHLLQLSCLAMQPDLHNVTESAQRASGVRAD
jgi:hypothetical protein